MRIYASQLQLSFITAVGYYNSFDVRSVVRLGPPLVICGVGSGSLKGRSIVNAKSQVVSCPDPTLAERKGLVTILHPAPTLEECNQIPY